MHLNKINAEKMSHVFLAREADKIYVLDLRKLRLRNKYRADKLVVSILPQAGCSKVKVDIIALR